MSNIIRSSRVELCRLATDVIRFWTNQYASYSAREVTIAELQYLLGVLSSENEQAKTAKENKTGNTQALEAVNARAELSVRRLKHYICGYYIEHKDINDKYRAFGLTSELIKERKKATKTSTTATSTTANTTTDSSNTNSSTTDPNTTSNNATTTTPSTTDSTTNTTAANTSITATTTNAANDTNAANSNTTTKTVKKTKRREYTPYGLPLDNDKRQAGIESVLRILTSHQATTPDFPNLVQEWQDLLTAHRAEWQSSRDIKANRSLHVNNAQEAEEVLREKLGHLRDNIKLDFKKQNPSRILRTFGFFNEI